MQNTWIRLLHPRLNEDGRSIRVDVQSTDLASSSDFSVVVLERTTIRRKEAVVFDNEDVFVASSLVASIRRQINRRLWVEELCINESIEESNKYVSLRPKVFAAAEDLNIGLDDIQNTSSPSLWRIVEFCGGLTDERLEQMSASAFINEISIIEALFNRPFWSDMARVQEFSVARRLSLSWGTETADWELIGPALWKIEQHCKSKQLPQPLWLKNLFCISDLRYRRVHWPNNWNSLTLDVLTWTRHFTTKDPRDRLFRLVGVCADVEALVSNLDYGDSEAKVLTDLTRVVIDEVGLRVLDLKTTSPAESIALPSWVPNWFILPSNQTTKDFLSFYMQYKADHNTLGSRATGNTDILTTPTAIKTSILCAGSVDGFTASPDVELPGTPSSTARNTTPDAPYSGFEEQRVVSALLAALEPAEPAHGAIFIDAATRREIGNPAAFQIHRRCLRHLFTHGSLADIEDGAYRQRLLRWLEANASLMVRGQALREWTRAEFHLHMSAPDFYYEPEPPEPAHFATWLRSVQSFFEGGSRLAATTLGEVIRVDGDLRIWDKVCWLKGQKRPWLLRQVDGGQEYRLVGPVRLLQGIYDATTKFRDGEELNERDWEYIKQRGLWVEDVDIV
jgi:hypothetical protein